jgi:hypothetical protein
MNPVHSLTNFSNKIILILFSHLRLGLWARGSVVVKALYYKAEGRGVRYQMRWFFLIYLILPVAVGPRVYSASNRNEYRKHIYNNVSGEWCVAGTLPLFFSRLSNYVRSLTSHNPIGLQGLLQGIALLYLRLGLLTEFFLSVVLTTTLHAYKALIHE